MDPGFEADFREFVIDRSGALFRTAYLLTGDRHAAEDLMQSALAKTAMKWRDLHDPRPSRVTSAVSCTTSR